MTEQTAERLPDEVQAAIEAAVDAIDQAEALGLNAIHHTLTGDAVADIARLAVRAAAPLLIEAGRRQALDGGRTEYGVTSGDIVFGATDAQTAIDRAAAVEFWTAVQRQVVESEWQPISEEGQA